MGDGSSAWGKVIEENSVTLSILSSIKTRMRMSFHTSRSVIQLVPQSMEDWIDNRDPVRL